MKIVLLVVNSEKSDLVVTENVHSIEETIIPVVEMTKNEAIGFVHLAETIILLSELNAIVAGSQSEVTFRNVAALSETTVADVTEIVADAETIAVEEDATIADLVTKNNIIEMTGFVLHVRMTTSLSELSVTNVENLGQEEVLAEEIHVEATEEVAPVADAMVDVEATEEVATAAEIVADVEATEEVASAADAMVDVEATEEVAPVADAMVTVEATEEVASAADAMVDVAATEEVALAADAMVTVEATEEVASVADAMVTVEATEEVASVADAMVTVEATEEVAPVADVMATVEATEEVAPVADVMATVEATEEVAPVADVEMTVQTNSIERPVENDLAMLTIDHLKKSSHVHINDAMTMTIKVKI
ncbi:hypothetical protein N9Y75_00010 [Candidatus Poseidoniales archaeon]|nr:hypothetical protein [Candidatus Poseidoniales archaeon]